MLLQVRNNFGNGAVHTKKAPQVNRSDYLFLAEFDFILVVLGARTPLSFIRAQTDSQTHFFVCHVALESVLNRTAPDSVCLTIYYDFIKTGISKSLGSNPSFVFMDVQTSLATLLVYYQSRAYWITFYVFNWTMTEENYLEYHSVLIYSCTLFLKSS